MKLGKQLGKLLLVSVFPEIEAALVSAEQYTQRLNFVKGSQISNQASQLIEENKSRSR